MIHDHISMLGRYELPMKERIISFLKEQDLLQLPVGGEIEIIGRDLLVRPSEYQSRLPEEGRFETHKVYADLQLVVRGAEIMQSVPADVITPATDYDVKGDYQFFTAQSDITQVVVRADEFVIYFPGEAHRPMCQRGQGPETVRKLVFKIRMK